MSSALSTCKEACASFVHAFPQLVFADDPFYDKNFFKEMFPNLQDASNASISNCTNTNEIIG